MKELKRGDRGAYVQMLQLALSRSGFAASTDGIFGPNTEIAVRNFQGAFGLPATGVINDATWNRLYPYIRGYVTYTIKSGDTFWNIAQRNYTTVAAIVTANPSVDPAALQIGQKIVLPFGFNVVPVNIAYTYALVELIIDGLVARYPFLRKQSAGSSVTGKKIYAVEMGSGDMQVFVNSSHHANEWITTPLALAFLENYAKSYAAFDKIYGYNASYLYNNATLFMIPLVNPDGVDLVNGVVEGEDFARARNIASNYPSIPFPSGWKANISGTDINLNYPALWEEAKKIKYAQGFTQPAPRDFVGTAPLSAPETRALYNYTLGKSFDITISYHTQGEVIFYEFQGKVPPSGLEIGRKFEDISGYSLESVPYNSSFAGYKDWIIQDFNVPSYTIEVGSGQNPLPLSQFSTIYNDNVGIMAYALSVQF